VRKILKTQDLFYDYVLEKIIYLTQGTSHATILPVNYLTDFFGVAESAVLLSRLMCRFACLRTFGWNTSEANSSFVMSLGCFSNFFFAMVSL
jgi:hypothetical protein